MHFFLLFCYGLGLVAATFVLSTIYSAISQRAIPGPFLARLTRLWYFSHVSSGSFEHENIALHAQHGSVVRVAPNTYSIDAPSAVPSIYGIASRMPKSEWYEGWKHPSPQRWTLFPDRDIRRHAETRRRFQGIYSMSSLLSYEGYVSECTELLMARLAEFAQTGKVLDLTHWLQCYAFDVMGNITYSRRFGFLDRGDDVAGIMAALDKNMVYSTLIGIVPALHRYVFHVLSFFGIGGAAGRAFLMKFVTRRVDERKKERGAHAEKSIDGTTPQDFVEKLLIQHDDDPAKVTDYHIFMMALSNIVAGADTTAISLSAVLYYLIKSPRCMQSLRNEVAQHLTGDRLSFKQTQDMPYLQAVIKEALRLHPATGLPLWRVVVDAPGLQVDDHLLPPGSVVGLNTWVAHYNENVFPHAREFRPERWLDASPDDLARMNAYYLPVCNKCTLCRGLPAARFPS